MAILGSICIKLMWINALKSVKISIYVIGNTNILGVKNLASSGVITELYHQYEKQDLNENK